MEKFKATYIGEYPNVYRFIKGKTYILELRETNDGVLYTDTFYTDTSDSVLDSYGAKLRFCTSFVLNNFTDFKKIGNDEPLNNITCELNCNHNKGGKCSLVNPKIQVGAEKFTCNSLEPTWSQEIECMYMAGFWINKEYKFCPYCKLKHE